jgi:hypothetical protein
MCIASSSPRIRKLTLSPLVSQSVLFVVNYWLELNWTIDHTPGASKVKTETGCDDLASLKQQPESVDLKSEDTLLRVKADCDDMALLKPQPLSRDLNFEATPLQTKAEKSEVQYGWSLWPQVTLDEWNTYFDESVEQSSICRATYYTWLASGAQATYGTPNYTQVYGFAPLTDSDYMAYSGPVLPCEDHETATDDISEFLKY